MQRSEVSIPISSGPASLRGGNAGPEESIALRGLRLSPFQQIRNRIAVARILIKIGPTRGEPARNRRKRASMALDILIKNVAVWGSAGLRDLAIAGGQFVAVPQGAAEISLRRSEE